MSAQDRSDGGRLPAGPGLAEWDSMAILVFGVVVACACALYGIYYGDLYVPALGIMCVFLLYAVPRENVSEFYRPIDTAHNPLTEAVIVLLLFLDWVLFLSQGAASYGLLVLMSGPLLFGFIIPLLFLVRLRGNTRASLGLTMNRIRDGLPLTIGFCTVLAVSGLIRLLISSSASEALHDPDVILAIMATVLQVGLVTGFTEEFVFRGVVQNRVSLFLGSRIGGLILTSSVFAAVHVFAIYTAGGVLYGGITFSLLYAFLTRLPLGILFGVLWNTSGNLLHPFLAHAVNNSVVVIVAIAVGS